MTGTVSSSPDPEVLIAGAGPTGLVLALWLTRLGVRVRIVDKSPTPAANSRALAIQARTLEFYAQLGFAQQVVDAGYRVPAVNLRAAGRALAHAEFGNLGQDISPYPFVLIFPQDQHEPFLIQQLRALGVEVERPVELMSFERHPDHVVAQLKMPDGSEQTCRTRFLTGCDGARSIVRKTLQIGFPGGDYTQMFYVADVQARGPLANGELQIDVENSDFLAIFPLDGAGRVRLVGAVQQHETDKAGGQLTWDDVSHEAIRRLGVEVESLQWFSTYKVHHRVAERFREDNIFLLGDAAHIHSPAGGQGMNTGIGDAINLSWKLAAVLHGQAPAALLDSFEAERIGFARRLVATTDRVFTTVTSQGELARLTRMHLVPNLLPLVLGSERARHLLFRTISQTAIHYRHSALSEGRTGTLQAGDRLPWVTLGEGTDNFAPLRSMAWQVHVYGSSLCPDVRRMCGQRGLELHVFPWRKEFAAKGLAENAVYLVRPDGYIGLADAEASARRLASYLDGQRLSFG